MKHRIYLIIISLLFSSSPLLAAPEVETVFERNLDKLLRAKVINKTKKELACFLAIDGYKIRFRLPPFQQSKWYKATDPRFTYTSFKTWCDYIEHHPRYKKYKFHY